MNAKLIPNVISIARLMLVPAFALVLLDRRFDMAVLLFLLMGVSDGLDGYLARRLDAKSELGEMLDPLADRVMLVTGFILLGHLGMLPMWLVVLTVARDVLVSGGALLIRLFRPEQQLQTTLIGKSTTFMQITVLLLVMLMPFLALPALLFTLLYWAVAALTIASGSWYLLRWSQIANGEQAK